MTLAFWNDGAPRKIKGTTVNLPGGSVIMGASVDPDIDLFNYVTAGPTAQRDTQRQLPSTFENDGWTITETRHVETAPIESLRVHKNSQVKQMRNTVMNAGIEWNGYTVQTDADSRREMVGAVVGLDKSGGDSQIWRMLDNVIVELTAAELVEMALAVHNHINSCYLVQGGFELTISMESDSEALLDIDTSAGWPAYYSPEVEIEEVV
jgi:hypothetical protein